MKLSGIVYFIVFLILMFLIQPLYIKQSVYESLYKSICSNKNAEVYIYNAKKGSVHILDEDRQQIQYLEDCYNGSCKSYANVSLLILKNWKNYKISFEPNEINNNQIRLNGPYVWQDDYGFIPVLVDYKDLYINGKKIDLPNSSFWHKSFYETTVAEEKGKPVEITVSVRKHHFKLGDFLLLYTTYKDWKLISIWHVLATMLVILFLLFLLYKQKYKLSFCFLVFICLILPLLYISKEDISEQENRMLAKFPHIVLNDGINEKFASEFNSWFSDRFGFRQMLIDLRLFVLYKINNKVANDEVFTADENWKFPTYGIKNQPSKRRIEEEKETLIKGIEKLNNSVKDKNINIYLVLEPNRSYLYKEYWENYYPNINLPYINFFDGLKQDLKKYPNIHFIDLTDIFEKNKKNLLYEKNDPHMTRYAMNLMMDKIIYEIGGEQKFKEYLNSVTNKDADCKILSYSNYFDYLLKIESNEPKKICNEVCIKSPKMIYKKSVRGFKEIELYNPIINKEVYLLFPCYGQFMLSVLGEVFKHTIFVHYNEFYREQEEDKELRKKAKEVLKSLKPDSVIIIFIVSPVQSYLYEKVEEYLEVR